MADIAEEHADMCEECGEEPAAYLVERRLMVTRIDSGEQELDAPEDAYEHDLMTDRVCEKCAKELYLEY